MRRILVLVMLLSPLLGGCGQEAPPPEEGEALPGPREEARTIRPARYATDLTFAPFDGGDPGLYYRFRQTTGPERLVREYRGWRLTPDGWRPLPAARDTLPVPRAGWRVLPARGIRVMVEEREEIAAVVFGDDGEEVRLQAGRVLDEWTGSTGQRERLRLARLRVGDREEPGLLVERRSALPLDATERGLSGLLLLTDARGDGLVIFRNEARVPGREPAAVDTAVARGWRDGEARRWPEVLLRETAGGGGSPPSRPADGGEEALPAVPAGWRLEGAEDGLSGRIRTRRTLGDSVRIYVLTGELSFDGRSREVSGIGVESGRP